MQITLRLKGFLKIAAFFLFIISVISYSVYKGYRYLSYRKIIYNNDVKQKKNLEFSVKVMTGDPQQKGYLLLTSIAAYHGKNYSSIIIMDPTGHVLMQKQMNGIVYDFRQWKNDGRIYYSYAINESAKDTTVSLVGSSGHIVILDSALNEIEQVHLKPFKGIGINKKQDLDLHDFIMLSDDHFITMASVPKTVNNIPVCLNPAASCKILAPVIQEVKNGTVVWQWDASSYPEFYLNSLSGNKFYDTTTTQDYIHMNSMILDPRDSNLIVSFLNQNQVLKIDRHSGNIIWRLGGRNSDFPMTYDQAFLKQHHATLADSNQTLLLLDNGDKEIRPYSRVLEFKLNEQMKTISSFKAYTIPARMAGSRGSVQKENDDYVICGGIANYLLIVNNKTGIKKTELKASQNFYRAYLVKDVTGVNLKSAQ